MDNDNNKKPGVIKATLKLQNKIGKGPLDERLLKPAQKVIDNNDVDFEPLGLAIMQNLDAALEQTANPSMPMNKVKEILTAPVMELKANASTFRYALVGDLATIMLRFLETLAVMDKDAVEIVRAHQQTLRTIMTRKMTGTGGTEGANLKIELQSACDRYYTKKFGK